MATHFSLEGKLVCLGNHAGILDSEMWLLNHWQTLCTLLPELRGQLPAVMWNGRADPLMQQWFLHWMNPSYCHIQLSPGLLMKSNSSSSPPGAAMSTRHLSSSCSSSCRSQGMPVLLLFSTAPLPFSFPCANTAAVKITT